MARFCSYCGKPLAENEACDCEESKRDNNSQFKKIADKVNVKALKNFWETMKERMGIGELELNYSDSYEMDRENIVPDCVTPNEGEIPVKQYNVATLRNRILGIPYIKAKGRLQITNKRVVFRAPGKCIAGKTTLQHEFEIGEISGIEARREYAFSFWDLIIAFWFSHLGSFLPSLIMMLMFESHAATIIFALIFGVAGCIPFFTLKKKWLQKLMCLGASVSSMMFPGMFSMYNNGGSIASFEFFLFGFLASVPQVLLWFSAIVYAIRPNLVLVVKTKGATDAVDIRRRRVGLLAKLLGMRGTEQEDHTGFSEIIPAEDAEQCIREVNAVISDIQKLGDFGIEKWKA